MKNKMPVIGLAVALLLAGCSPQDNSSQHQSNNSSQTKNAQPMKNLISIVEIPVADFSRAVKFYQEVLGVTIEEMEMGGVTMGILPHAEGTVNVVLAKGSDYKPSTDGPVLYLQANDLQVMLDKVTQQGGKVIVPKTLISPEMGYFALFIDTEGNKLGLHATQ